MMELYLLEQLIAFSRQGTLCGGLRPGASLGLVAAALQALSSNERFHGDEKLR